MKRTFSDNNDFLENGKGRDALEFHDARRCSIERLRRLVSNQVNVGAWLIQALSIGVIQCLMHKPSLDCVTEGKNRESLDLPFRRAGLSDFVLSFGVGAAAFAFQAIVCWRTRSNFPAPAGDLNLIFSIGHEHNGNRHLLNYLSQDEVAEQYLFIDLDTGFFRSAGTQIDVELKSRLNVVNPYLFRNLFLSFGSQIRHSIQIAGLVAEMRCWCGLKDVIKRSFHLSRNLIRGACLDRFVSGIVRDGSTRSAIFGNLNTDCAASDYRCRTKGIRTIHWLHGTVEDEFKYYGFSSVCVTLSDADAEIRRRFGEYQQVYSEKNLSHLPSAGAVIKTGLGLILTNLLHPGHQLPLELRRSSLTNLIKIMAARTGVLYSWCPHPMEVISPEFHFFAAEAERLGVRVLKPGAWRSMLHDVESVICTFSGSIVDLIRRGIVPVVWAEVRYPDIGLWARLPEGLLFDDADSLDIAIVNAVAIQNDPHCFNQLADILDARIAEGSIGQQTITDFLTEAFSPSTSGVAGV